MKQHTAMASPNTHTKKINVKPEKQLNTFLVGGAVRDALLGKKVVDRDYLVVGSTVNAMLALGFVQVGKDFPVFLHPDTKDEYALARTEKKAGEGYTGFTCYANQDVTIEEDLLRRDLTVNAIAMSPNGEYTDPYNGRKDLHDKVLRHVSDAFIEDPLRVLRVARFAARFHDDGFTIAPETLTIMKKLSESGELTTLSGERVFKELQRSFEGDHPEVFIQTLKDCGALKSLLPEVDCLWGIPNPVNWHPEICSGIHTIMVIQQAVLLSNKVSVRFAALCHDLGKGLTNKAHWPSHRGHEKSGLPLVKAVCKRLKVPSEYEQLALKVCEYHLHCHKAFELKASTILTLFNSLDVWRKPEQFEDFLLACTADARGRKGLEQQAYTQADFLLLAAKEATKVIAKPFIEQGKQGKAIKEAIDQERINVIKTVKQNYPS